jgi:trigger factor
MMPHSVNRTKTATNSILSDAALKPREFLMKVTQEKLPNSQIGLEIELPGEMSKQAYNNTVQRFSRSLNIPGFRKGKVPRHILVQRIGGQRIKASVLEELIDENFKKAIEQLAEENDIVAIGNYKILSDFDELLNHFEPGQPLTFSASADVMPEVKLEDYKGLSVQVEEVKPDLNEVDEILERYRKQAATLVPIEDRPCKQEDQVVIDMVGYIMSDDNDLEGRELEYDLDEDSDSPSGENPSREDENLENENVTAQDLEGEKHIDKDGIEWEEFAGGTASDFQVELTEGRFIPGFCEGIVGMAIGDTRDVITHFPEDYHQGELAGLPVKFSVTLKEIKQPELPELDDDLAEEVSEFETLAELRESIETRIREMAEAQTKRNRRTTLLSALVEKLEVELPETLIQQEVRQMLQDTAIRLSQQGMDVKKLFTPDLIEQLQQTSRPEAAERLKRSMVLLEVIERESIEVDDEEIAAAIQEIEEETGMAGQDSNREDLEETIRQELMSERAMALLESFNTVEYVPEGKLNEDNVEAALEAAATAGQAVDLEDAVDASELAEASSDLTSSDPADDAATDRTVDVSASETEITDAEDANA